MYSLSDNDKMWTKSVWQKLDSKLCRTAVSSFDKLPYTTINGVHNDDKVYINKWTNGFWGGLMWLMYIGTGNEVYKKTALHSEELLDEALKYPEKLDHDVGFLWQITSGVNYTLTGDENSKRRLIHAANSLMGRFYPNAHFIRAWNGEGREGYAIIDCMMNLPLLYLCSKLSGDDRYKEVAVHHADMTLKNHLCPDGSSHHIVNYDTKTGEVISFEAGQGYRGDSAWSRGQTWAIYGFLLSFIHTGDQKYLDASKCAANYFIANIAVDNWLPRVDFKAPGREIDSTAGASAASALLELALYVNEEEKNLYITSAMNILKALESKYCNWSDTEDSILQNGVERYKSDSEVVTKPIIYGDYYFAEAIYKLKGFKPMFW